MTSPLHRVPKLRQAIQSAPDHAAAAETDAPFTANMQLAYLESVVKDWSERKSAEPEPAYTPPLPPTPAQKTREPVEKASAPKAHERSRLTAVAKSCVALAVAALLGWVPLQRLLATTSAEATVNARLITVRAPIEGEVTLANAGADIGTAFQAGQEILSIVNPRADTSRLSSLRKDRDQTRTTIAALEGKKQVLLSGLAELAAQQERFRLGRIELLQQRIRETDSDIAAAEAQLAVASATLRRVNFLKTSDAISQANVEKADGEANVAKETVRGLTERRKGMLVELASAKSGTFIGDSYNDTPQSAQRKMEAELELSDVNARLAGSKTELATIDSDLAEEVARQKKLSEAVIHSTVNGRIWELLTAPGEHVNAGQDLLKVLDCGSAMVTASVSETAFQKLSIRQRATFTTRGGAADIEGYIVGLNGLGAVESNSAIQQTALTREPYHVTLKFPELARPADCQIGRTGLVQFDTSGRLAPPITP